jgi:glycosyltransferase involved in cell wall biosynthesis
MRCPRLKDLPPPPPGKTGWPWTEESVRLPEVMPDGAPWPRISIVTPSYNQGQFLEETIRSVLLQGYPNLEYIVIDGGSTDGSIDLITKYAEWITFWEAARDRGQADALNKGFARATGKIRAYLNSDDVYFPDIFGAVASLYAATPDQSGFFAFFSVEHFGEIHPHSTILRAPDQLQPWLKGRAVCYQPGVFWSKHLHDAVGPFDIGLHYSFDEKFFVAAISRGFKPLVNKRVVAAGLRYHHGCKTVTEDGKDLIDSGFLRERRKLRREFAGRVPREDWRAIVSFLRQGLMSEKYNEAIRSPEVWSRTLSFARTALVYPSAISTRFYWGAVKELLVRKPGRNG